MNSDQRGGDRRDIQSIEPGVDEGAARSTKAASPESLSDAGLGSRASARTTDAEHRDGAGGIRRAVWLAVGLALAVIAIVVLAFLVPTAPALAWIGIALQVALAALLVVSALALPAGGYRASRFAWITGFQAAAVVVVLVLILVVALV
ncbi:hypothetical protein [Microbacterium sp. T2.11-28]|uniref:hypothetical protein n=1 Tax=Microbacterium sp. T2.11-28 TaxID=3041169 RepID=UPI00247764B8|nr:hypothetical protein [Microbacterium sp. T2.11-28]CAI9390293.1 hypothetical protein MICABA_01405 [Microbacterium sp. T2.11-28]